MLFTSIEFLFVFLPVALAGCFLLPFRFGLKNYWLLLRHLVLPCPVHRALSAADRGSDRPLFDGLRAD